MVRLGRTWVLAAPHRHATSKSQLRTSSRVDPVVRRRDTCRASSLAGVRGGSPRDPARRVAELQRPRSERARRDGRHRGAGRRAGAPVLRTCGDGRAAARTTVSGAALVVCIVEFPQRPRPSPAAKLQVGSRYCSVVRRLSAGRLRVERWLWRSFVCLPTRSCVYYTGIAARPQRRRAPRRHANTHATGQRRAQKTRSCLPPPPTTNAPHGGRVSGSVCAHSHAAG
jgi:hypothetical protein